MDTSTDTLNQLWAQWLEKYDSHPSPAWLPRYNNVARHSERAIRFETWVESHGGRVVQKNKRRYIEVWDENLFMMLVLTHV